MNRSKLIRLLLALLVVVAGGALIARGPARMLPKQMDLDIAGPTVGAQAWIEGLNPYDPSMTQPMIADALGREWEVINPYPPPTLVVFTPLALLPWSLVPIAWLTFSVVLLGLMMWALLDLAGLRAFESRGLVVIAFILALAPIHTGLSVGQPGVPAIALGVLSIWAAARKREWLAGALVGFAVCIKPQLGGAFLLYLLVSLRWRAGGLGLAIAVGITLIGAGRLWLLDFDWVNDLRGRIGLFAHEAAYRDSEKRFGFINAHVLLHQMIDSTRVVKVLVLVGIGGTCIGYLWLLRRAWGRAHELLCASVPMVLSLLVVYHRAYDAMMIVLPLTWAIMRWRSGPGRWPLVVIVCCVPFLIPGGTMLTVMIDREMIPDAIVGGWLWNVIVMPHQIWALIVMVIALCAALHDAAGAGCPSSEVDGPSD